MKTMKILIVEDDRTLNNGIALSFGKEHILQAFCLDDARKLFDKSIDLIILDSNLPDGSGLDFCHEIRQTSSVPIIFLTANDTEIDIVTGLETGADDYITKPFSLSVLRARVNAVLRRKNEPENTFKQGIFMFDFDTMTFIADGSQIDLSVTEQKLLKLLVKNHGTVLPRDMLIDRIWSDGAEFVEGGALSVTVSRLREKLKSAPIKTVYGIGYIWENL